MSYSKLLNLIKDDSRLTSFIKNISNDSIEIPFIMTETLSILDDNSILYNAISDNNKKALCHMMDEYFKYCWGYYIDNISLDSLLKYGKIEVYKVNAPNGLRYATVNEVDKGIKGLIGEYIYPAGEDIYKKLCLLQWTFSGVSYYFRQAGYKLNYDSNGKVTNTFYEMIQMCAYDMKDMFEWLSCDNNIDKALNRIKKLKKSRGYKYATYEKDEITEDITIKQLVMNIYKTFPRNSANKDYRKALSMAIRCYKDKKELTPLEISELREIYDAYALDSNSRLKNNNINIDVKDKCEKLLSERFSGKIDQNHFVYKVISTIKKDNYSKCSPKQYDIIKNAYSIIEKDNIDLDSNIISDDDIDREVSIYDITSGEMFDDDDSE